MKQLVSLLLLTALTFSTVVPLYAQGQQQDVPDEVVRISTKLVQIDAVVTDKSGNLIKDLSASDFEVLQDGKPQQIVSVSYVNTEAPAPVAKAAESKPSAKTDKSTPPPPPTRTTSGGRILTFVVDDGSCSASRTGILATQEALQKFINEQMRPDDLVSIYQTRSGSSILQQYTADKAQLLRVAKQVRWYPPRGICANDGAGDFYDRAQVTGGTKFRANPVEFESAAEKANRANTENRLRDNQVVGLVGVLRYITRGLQRVPGRKTVFLFSDGIPLMASDSTQRGAPNTSPLVTLRQGESGSAMRDLIDFANRASVVFNTIDVRGVRIPDGALASDDFDNVVGRGGTGNIQATNIVAANREAATQSAQSGLYYLADETGGRFYDDTNNLEVPVRRALALEKGYYLIGYQPEADTFKSKKFNQIEIKVRRPDVNVRARSGFLGITDEDRRPKKRSGDSELYEAIAAPLPKAGLNLQLTAFFGNTAAEGSFVRTLLHLDGERVSFVDDANGMKKGVIDVVAVTLNEKNEVVDEFNRTHTIRFPALYVDTVVNNGLIYTADIPVKKPGVYNFRVALRDANSKLLGSAGQQIEVPDLKKQGLLLSGLTVSEVQLRDGKAIVRQVEKSEPGFSPVASVADPAIRRFAQGAILGYSYKLYNAELDKATQQPNLTVQVRLYRDGVVVTDNPAQAPQLDAQTDMTRIADYGYLRLQPDIIPGEYALQITIRDLKANKLTSQWVDFEVVK